MGFIGLLVNIPVNYIFIYGHFGMPELGGVGCGVATASVYWVMFASMLWWVRRSRSMRDIRCAEVFSGPDFAVLLRLVQLGLPIALALFFEVTLFAVVALLVSPLGIIDVAGHQIALNFSSLMFVLPLSLAAAVTIRVGFRLGQGSTIDAQVSARTGVGVGVCLAVFTAIFTVLMRKQIALLYNDNPEVVMLASHLMLLAAVYQISDSIQVIGSGILRGYKDTRSIFFITFTAYWVLGLPSGYLLALTDVIVPRMGPAGFWCGFIIGLTSAAIMMMLRMRFLQRQPSSIILPARRALILPKPATPAGFFFLQLCSDVVHSVTPRHQRLTDERPGDAYSVANSPAVGLLRKPIRGFQHEKSISSGCCRCYGSVICCFRSRRRDHHPGYRSQPHHRSPQETSQSGGETGSRTESPGSEEASQSRGETGSSAESPGSKETP